jgi:alkylation response protein AidB-like acyl-CoA dehydrogenase
MADSGIVDAQTLQVLRNNAADADTELAWPAHSWKALQAVDVLQWCIPRAQGGLELDGIPLLKRYEQLASACLTTCFILSQRDAACRRLRDHGHSPQHQQWLAELARGGSFATVGLSQLTTSRQHGAPALGAREVKDGYELDGVAPWVTGAEHADFLILGATLADGRQIMGVVPGKSSGLQVGAPLELTALRGSLTAVVNCRKVILPRGSVLAGPIEQVMQTGRGGTGGLETSSLALGLARAAVDHLNAEAQQRPALAETASRLDRAYHSVRSEMYSLASESCSSEAAVQLRAKANALVLRSTQAALTASKGAGFVHPHPAQRWARQALFFLVWSCPQPAAAATLDALIGNDASFCS